MMMSRTVKAIYENGLLRPLEPVSLPEKAHVHITIEEAGVTPVSVAHLQQDNPAEWLRHFNDFVSSLPPNMPVLSDEAMKRESIYPDRS
ncbi:MAG: antitoxin family protein [bacterium]